MGIHLDGRRRELLEFGQRFFPCDLNLWDVEPLLLRGLRLHCYRLWGPDLDLLQSRRYDRIPTMSFRYNWMYPEETSIGIFYGDWKWMFRSMTISYIDDDCIVLRADASTQGSLSDGVQSGWVTVLTINISKYESSAMVACVSMLIREAYNTTTGDFFPLILSEVYILMAILSLFIVSIWRSSECKPSMRGGGYNSSVAAAPLATFSRIMSRGWDLKSIVGRKPIFFSSYNISNKANWDQTCSQSSFKLPILATSSSGIMMDLLMIQIGDCM